MRRFQPDDRQQLAAYLGHEPSRLRLGEAAPSRFQFQSLLQGGDRNWRVATRQLGHAAVVPAACAVAGLALDAYRTTPDSSAEVDTLGLAAGAALARLSDQPGDAQALAEVKQHAIAFSLAVDVGGPLRLQAGFRGQVLGRVVGRCASVVLAPENPRYVRWLGEAAEQTCRNMGVSEEAVCLAVSTALLHSLELPLEADGSPDLLQKADPAAR